MTSKLPAKIPYFNQEILQNPDGFEKAIENRERQLAQSVLQSLGCHAFNGKTFADILDYETKTHSFRFCYYQGNTYYIPFETPLELLKKSADSLRIKDQTPQIEAAVGELYLLTKAAKVPDKERDAKLFSYVRRLTQYPADFVVLTLHRMSESQTFFPAWAEIQSILDQTCGWRRMFLTAMRTAYLTINRKRNLE